ncbi:acyl-CoA dehydrogenase [Mycobacterium heckeshornense]|uniref:Acyl-CoA dehydrogenase n=1 Tax=Mycobacterium heckeshornense TaxID=110505 RepID=A0A2G8BDD3_9MYCO|nr:acyl-CoA dehydrogenase family protein [Mycobacterium heckeshornense]KMV23058.1 acyl-CoA dehydrogenase [Mycobacterium heckeshornense]MCV7036053.1 acyl-CoA/acyl-ACP dehydrogenase [Mycobacterium heckeshornense]PIJ35734.1 acyl-CoA dehydrogenase [Mycobacterium heckeshornense]BCO35892.1 acyl-CoA dehydrogenase [Mycobacterium heckeshornense]
MTSADTADLDLLRVSARKFLAERGAKQSVEDLAALDWTGLLVDEALGGAGWRPVETCVVAEELGRAQDRSAWLGTTLAAAAVASAPEDVRQRWLSDLLSGAVTAGVVGASIARVVGGDQVSVIVTLSGNGIHLIDGAAVAVEIEADLLDVTRPVWRVDIGDAPRVAIGSPQRAAQLAAVARLLVAADSLGAVSMALERLTAYLKKRVAFGVPIASFQAIQHRLVDLFVFEVKARAVVMKAARAAAADDDRVIELSTVAHAFVTAKATAAVDECMQLSGGIGFTWEYPLHHELRRVFSNAQLMGSPRSSRALLAEVSGW